MLTNRSLSVAYLNSTRGKERVFQIISAKVGKSEEEIHKIVKNWMKRFTRRWIRYRCQSRFMKNEQEWLNSDFMVTDESMPLNQAGSSNTPVRAPGRKRLRFQYLSESVKDRRSRHLAKEPLEKLLRSAEKAAHHSSFSATAKILKYLRTKGDSWASCTLQNLKQAEKLNEPSAEMSLMLKTRLSLSKSQYQAVAKFSKQVLGIKMLKPWVDVMELRNKIIPDISTPNWNKGYLSTQVILRDMIANDVARMIQIEEVELKVCALCEGEAKTKVDCILYVAAGLDSATGFANYDQGKILRKDDSLLTEHIMCLRLVAKGEELWVNPSPQSDIFCHALSMNWVKETADVTKSMFNAFVEEVNDIKENPIIVTSNNVELRVTLSIVYSLIDGKAANAIVDNRNTHVCPLTGCFKDANSLVMPSYYHARLNFFEWLIRVSAQKKIDGNPAQSHVAVKEKAREIANEVETCFNINVNRPKAGGSGTCNHGNTARIPLSDPEQFAKILGISGELVANLRMISCLALSSKRLDDTKVEELYNTIERQIMEEFPFIRRLPPCIHKYSHMPELIRNLPFPLSFIDEQAGERCHKRYKYARTHLARKTSPEHNILDMMRVSLAWSDIKMSFSEHQLKKSNRPNKAEKDFDRLMKHYFADQNDQESKTEHEEDNDAESDLNTESDFEDSDENI